MSARRARSDDAVFGRLTGVDSVFAFFLLEDAEFHVGLGNFPECRLQSSVPPVPDDNIYINNSLINNKINFIFEIYNFSSLVDCP